MSDPLDALRAALADRYTIERELGAGGMATVYLARDLKHHRKVGVKVLRPELAAVLGAERFLREIEIAAKLTHPHILPLHDSGHTDGFLYYVMPYIEGESLRGRLERERQLPIDDAIRIAQQSAAALEYAHAEGVIHRDIKPENILLHRGDVMVADFGIALAVNEAGGSRLTETGLSIGTPQYMSPEQASGDQHIDARTDIYSLGCVFYEMLVGEAPYTGPTSQAIIAKVLTEPPPSIRDKRDTVSQALERVALKSLAKLAADRFDSAREFARALEEPPAWAIPAEMTAGRAAQARGIRLQALPWTVTLLTVVVASLAIWSPWRGNDATNRRLATFVETLDPGRSLTHWPGSPVKLSRDGTQLVYTIRENGTTRLYHRSLAQAEPEPIAGTDGATAPFFSPDGNWVAFFADEKLKKVSLSGGAPQTITDAEGPRTGSWGVNDTIVIGSAGNLDKFAPRSPTPSQTSPSATTLTRDGLSAVPASGGSLHAITTPLTHPEEIHETHHWPQVLPDAKAVLFTVYHGPGWKREKMRIVALSLETGEVHELVEPGTFARYVPTGHIVYAWAGDILAVPFDAANLRVTGSPVPVAEGVQMHVTGSALFDVSDNGSLVYVRGVAQQFTRSLEWIDLSGRVDSLELASRYYQSPRISPSGDRLLVSENYGRFVIHDLVRGTEWGLTDGQGAEFWAVWSPDGETVVFNSNRMQRRPDDDVELFRTTPDGSTTPELLLHRPFGQIPQAIALDQRQLIFVEHARGKTDFDIWSLPLDDGAGPHPLIQTPANEFHPALSPDGRWIAYASDASGRAEVYVRPFPALHPITVISPGGGREPVWSPDGRVLYYRSDAGNELLAVSLETSGTGLAVGSPSLVAKGAFAASEPWGRNYDITPDGERFLMIMEGEPTPAPIRFVITLNWFDELKAKVGN